MIIDAEPGLLRTVATAVSRIGTMCLVELQKLRHDRTELLTRAVQPALWLVVFGNVFTQLHAIPTGDVPYLDYLAPGILAQSALFIAIFYGIQIIWERDAGVLAKLLVTPTPRVALVAAKAFAAGIRAIAQAVIVLLLALLLGVGLSANPLHWLGVVVAMLLGAAFFCCLSIAIAGLVLSRDRLMGIGQAITMPLFFASNALYPVELMPGLAAGDQPRQPAELRGGRPPRPAHRHTDEPVAGLRGAARVGRTDDHRGVGAAAAAGARLTRRVGSGWWQPSRSPRPPTSPPRSRPSRCSPTASTR